MPYDWSHRHVIFSKPATKADSKRIEKDPRYWHQYLRRSFSPALTAPELTNDDFANDERILLGSGQGQPGPPRRRARLRRSGLTISRDWSVSLGPNATVGAGNYPAKFSFDVTTANCGTAPQPDFVVFNTGVSGSQASIVAYDNLYSGCGKSVPTTYWAYNNLGIVATSITLSLDGSQIAFIQNSVSASGSQLVLLKWAPSTDGATSTNPDAITFVSADFYPFCSAPCATALALSPGTDSNSSPFYDFAHDALYVGDDAGLLHKFQPVFTTGVPSEVTVSGLWPAPVQLGSKLTSPVYDSGTGRVFVGSNISGGTGGQLFAVDGRTGLVLEASPQLATGDGITSPPIVDTSAGLVYVFVGADTGGVNCVFGGTICSAVYQFPADFISSGGTETPVSLGSASPGFAVYAGTFDNSYFTSADATGSLYVCGQNRGGPQLFKIPILAGSMATQPVNNGMFAFPPMNTNVPCSPITEIFNPNLNSGVDSGGPQGTDKIFFSTQGTDNLNPCDRGGNGGCLWALPATAWQPATSYTLGQVILDDGRGMCLQVVTTAGTSGSTEPSWGVNPGVSAADSGVTWTGKMCFNGVNPPQSWLPNVGFGAGFSILDTNGNIEAATVNLGTTGSTQPIWPAAIGAQTPDGAQIWVNVGPLDVSTLPVSGGTSGVIMDNTVPAGSLPGATQIYFSPLSLGFGTCGPGNGCAVQASQSNLN